MKINKTQKKYITISIIIILLIIATIFLKTQLTGKAISNLDIKYEENQPLKGTLTLTTKEGELIPASSILKFKTSEDNYEFILKDLLEENQIEGNYYIENTEISGNGTGYGIYGNTEDSPDITFTLEIIDDDKEELENTTKTENEETNEESTTEETDTEESATEGTSEESTTEETDTEESTTEGTSEESTTEETDTEESTTEGTDTEESATEGTDTEESTTEGTSEESTTEGTDTEESATEGTSEESTTEETDTNEEKEETTNVPEELFDIKVTLGNEELKYPNKLIAFVEMQSFGKISPTIDISYYILDQSNNQVYTRTQKEIVQTEKTIKRTFTDLELEPGKYKLIVKTHYGENIKDEFTKDFIILKKNIFEKIKGGIASIFSKKLTGKVSYTWEGEKEIIGSLNSEEPYTIKIPEGKTIKIIKNSIKDGEKTLSENEIEIIKKDNQITIATNYQNEETKGFGSEYTGGKEKNFEIDITKLNITLKSSILTTTLEYKNATIIKIEKTLGEEEIQSNILPLEKLTEEELEEKLQEIYNKIGNVSLKITEDETNNNKIVKYEIGKYWNIHSYDKNLNSEKLEEYKNIDKRRFIEDLKNQLK